MPANALLSQLIADVRTSATIALKEGRNKCELRCSAATAVAAQIPAKAPLQQVRAHIRRGQPLTIPQA
jgi:hypothetical protein